MDLFNQVNLSANHNELGVKEFSTISIIIISHILQGRCVNVKKDNQTLPCKSYFTSSLFGSKSRILLKDLLTNIGLGNENSVDKVGTKWLSLQFLALCWTYYLLTLLQLFPLVYMLQIFSLTLLQLFPLLLMLSMHVNNYNNCFQMCWDRCRKYTLSFPSIQCYVVVHILF